jgi:2-methylisocitrate lyase-like PEP mutase family enzyme
MSKSVLRRKLDNREFFVAPGLHDMVAAVLARELGFEIVYGTGFWMTASCYGLPDAGLATYTQMLDRMSTLKKISGATVIGDADTGYGGLLNVHHTVRGYEAAGVSGIQIEDQEFPKRCGHTSPKRLISTKAMMEKIRVACEARQDPSSTVIIARTDARGEEGFDGAIRRAMEYANAGADLLFVEALRSEEEMRTACREIAKPMLANMVEGGRTPIRSATQLSDIGYAGAIFPASAALAASASIAHVLGLLKRSGTTQGSEFPLYDFAHFCRLIGMDEVLAFEQKWAQADVSEAGTRKTS